MCDFSLLLQPPDKGGDGYERALEEWKNYKVAFIGFLMRALGFEQPAAEWIFTNWDQLSIANA